MFVYSVEIIYFLVCFTESSATCDDLFWVLSVQLALATEMYYFLLLSIFSKSIVWI